MKSCGFITGLRIGPKGTAKAAGRSATDPAFALFQLGEQPNMSKTTTSGKTPKPPRPMTAEAIERAARGRSRRTAVHRNRPQADEANATGESHPPGLGTDARGICGPLSHSPRYASGLGTRSGGTGSAYAGVSHNHCPRSRPREPDIESKAKLDLGGAPSRR